MGKPYKECVQSIERDYWRLQLWIDKHSKSESKLQIQGRRRATEPFWHPLLLPLEHTERLTKAMEDARGVARGFGGHTVDLPSFPNYEILAICQGPFYRMELAETLSGSGARSIMTTLYRYDSFASPVAHFIDEELVVFCQDLLEIATQIPNYLQSIARNYTIESCCRMVR